MEIIVKTNTGGIKCYTDTPMLVPAKCKGCGTQIYWVKTQRGRSMPVEMINNSEFESHFARCPKADSFRKNHNAN